MINKILVKKSITISPKTRFEGLEGLEGCAIASLFFIKIKII